MNNTASGRVYVHPWIYAVLALVGAAVFFVAASAVDGDSVGAFELTRFRMLNDLPGFLAYPVWPFMQFGAMGVIPLGALIAAFYRRWRLVVAFLIVGGAKLLLAKAIKSEVVRHRPSALIDDVNVRIGSTETGLGFVSGHATIAVGVAVILHPYLRARWMRIVLWTVVALVLYGRVYVGAHFPLDVTAGAAVGVVLGSLVNLALGVPGQVETVADDARAESPHL